MAENHAEIKTGDYRTYYNFSGANDAETILFLHGSGPGVTAWSNWQYALPALGEQFRCLAPDLVGFGATQHPANPPTGMINWMRLWVDQCLAFMDGLGIKKAHVVGNSMGGAIAMNLLMYAPERFDRIVLMGPVGAPYKITPEIDRLWGFYEDPSEQMFKNVIRWFVYDDAFIADRLDGIAKTRFAASLDPDVRRSFMAMFPAPRQKVLDDLVVPELALRRMHNPILLIHGRDDKIVPMETSLYLLERLSNVQLHVFGQCSHWIQIEHAKRFNQALLEFFCGRI